MNTYIAITIGPVFNTIRMARKTRELWAASYIFSYLMKQIINLFKDERRFLLPCTEEPELFEIRNGVGLFPDRCIFYAEAGDFERLQAAIPEILKKLAVDICTHLSGNNQTEKITGLQGLLPRIEEYMSHYFKIYFLEIELDQPYPILEINNYLDQLELEDRCLPEENVNYLQLFFQRIHRSFLLKDAFAPVIKRFPSLPELATRELAAYLTEETRESVYAFTGEEPI